MTTSAEVQELILEKLSHGPFGPYMIAAAIDEAPFRVRAELKELKRARLVAEHLSPDVHVFSLTGSGYARLSGHVQLKLTS